MDQSALERYLPVPVDEAFEALRLVVSRRFTVESVDEHMRSVTFSSGVSLFTWGETFIAHVAPSGDGSTIRVVGSAKTGGALAQIVGLLVGSASAAGVNTGKGENARFRKLTAALFDDILAIVRPKNPPSPGQPPTG